MKATPLAALSIGTTTKSFYREDIVFLTSYSVKMGFSGLHVILFLRVWIFFIY